MLPDNFWQKCSVSTATAHWKDLPDTKESRARVGFPGSVCRSGTLSWHATVVVHFLSVAEERHRRIRPHYPDQFRPCPEILPLYSQMSKRSLHQRIMTNFLEIWCTPKRHKEQSYQLVGNFNDGDTNVSAPADYWCESSDTWEQGNSWTSLLESDGTFFRRGRPIPISPSPDLHCLIPAPLI